MLRLISIIITISFIPIKPTIGCTAFYLKNGSDHYVSKNLDWSIENGYVFLNERNVNKSILVTELFSANEFKWTSKYRSITFNQFGKEFPLGGMNEQGLVIEELNMSPIKLIRDSTKQLINEFQLVQYLLDNCKSVDEIICRLKRFQIKPLFQTLHYLIADKTGNVILAEFNGSDFGIYFPDRMGFPILSNNNYNESLKYLANFQGFGGDLPVKNRKGSNERFVSVANLLKQYKNQHPIAYSFQILDTVKQEDTKWSLVYDIKNLSVNFKFHSCEMVKVFDFKDLVGLETISGLGANLTDCKLTGNVGLKKVSTKENTFLIQNVFCFYAQQDNSEGICNLLYQMAMLGNRNLKGIKDED